MTGAAAPFEGPEAALSTGIVPLILICVVLVWIVFTRAWAARDEKDYYQPPDLSDWKGGERYARALAGAIAAHPAGRVDAACRYLPPPVPPTIGTPQSVADNPPPIGEWVFVWFNSEARWASMWSSSESLSDAYMWCPQPAPPPEVTP